MNFTEEHQVRVQIRSSALKLLFGIEKERENWPRSSPQRASIFTYLFVVTEAWIAAFDIGKKNYLLRSHLEIFSLQVNCFKLINQ